MQSRNQRYFMCRICGCNRKLIKLVILLMTAVVQYGIVSADVVYNPYFHFPGGSEGFMGLIAAIEVPVEAETPGEVLFSVITEASYVLPTNETEFNYPPIISSDGESSERQIFYKLVEGRLTDFGYAGKNCLLRSICEASEYSSKHTGVLGDILHILLTPSSSKKESNLAEYEAAEILGRKRQCRKYKIRCKFSILNAFSRIGNFFRVQNT